MKTIFLFSLILFLSGCGCYQVKKYLQSKVKPQYYYGKVMNKNIDTSDRMTPKITFVDGSIIDMDAYEMYDDLQPGDSIIKPAGTLKYVLIRDGQGFKVYYPKCDGKEIK